MKGREDGVELLTLREEPGLSSAAGTASMKGSVTMATGAEEAANDVAGCWR